MNAYTCTKFEGVYPVGVAAMVVANDHCEAAQLLNLKLNESGFGHNFVQPCDVELVDLSKVGAVILADGVY